MGLLNRWENRFLATLLMPKRDPTGDGIRIGAEYRCLGKRIQELGIATPEENRVGDEGRAQAIDNIMNGTSPSLLSAALETGKADVLLVGSVLLVRKVGELERHDVTIAYERRP